MGDSYIGRLEDLEKRIQLRRLKEKTYLKKEYIVACIEFDFIREFIVYLKKIFQKRG